MDLLLIISRRLAIGVLTVLVVSMLVFAGTELLPGDIARAILGQSATPEAIANINIRLGLDQPAYVRYLTWFGNLLQGDLGTSLTSSREVSVLIAERGSNSFLLAGVTALVAVPLSIFLGADQLYPHQVSGGQLQRLMAAMAMMCHPKLLIMDEPTTTLDVTTQIELLQAFKRLIREQNVVAIYVSNDLAVVAQMADDILVLKDGPDG